MEKVVDNNKGLSHRQLLYLLNNLLENIRYGRLSATDEQVINAAKIVRADDFIKAFNDGYRNRRTFKRKNIFCYCS